MFAQQEIWTRKQNYYLFGLETLTLFLLNYFFKSLRLTFNSDIWVLYKYNQIYPAVLTVVYLLGTFSVGLCNLFLLNDVD